MDMYGSVLALYSSVLHTTAESNHDGNHGMVQKVNYKLPFVVIEFDLM